MLLEVRLRISPGERGLRTRRGSGGGSRALKGFCILLLIVAHALIKVPPVVHLKFKFFTVYNLYFNF